MRALFDNFPFCDPLLCGSAPVSQLPESMERLRKLCRVDVSSNSFAKFPSVLCSLPLVELHMSKCRYSGDPRGPLIMPRAIGGLTRLRSLEYASNELVFVPDTLASLVHRKSLHLQNNRLRSVNVFSCLRAACLLSVGS